MLEDEKTYMVFEDFCGTRHFVDYSIYEKYNLRIHTPIKCLLQKINCVGRIFLEPMHPVYRRGSTYVFKVTYVHFDQITQFITVDDCYANSIRIDISHLPIKTLIIGNEIKATVINIKKGVPELVMAR